MSNFYKKLTFLSGLSLIALSNQAFSGAINNHFLPPQSLPIPDNTHQTFATDLNGDGFTDFVFVRWNTTVQTTAVRGTPSRQYLTFPGERLEVTVWLNKGIVKTLDQLPEFEVQNIVIDTDESINAARAYLDSPLRTSWVNNTSVGGAFVEDMNGDGKPDIVAYSASTGYATVLWSQSAKTSGKLPLFENKGSSDVSKTHLFELPLSRYAPPVACAAARVMPHPRNLPALVCYHAGSPVYDQSPLASDLGTPADNRFFDPRAKQKPPYEALSVIPRLRTAAAGSPEGFNTSYQSAVWPGDNLALGKGVTIDGFSAAPKIFDLTKVASGTPVFDLVSQLATNADGSIPNVDSPFLGHVAHASEILKVQANAGSVLEGTSGDLGDALWIAGQGGRLIKFTFNATQKLMKKDKEYSFFGSPSKLSSLTFADLSEATGKTSSVIVTGGGQSLFYDPPRGGLGLDLAQESTLPEYFKGFRQLGAHVQWEKFNGLPTLLTTSSYIRPTLNDASIDYRYDRIKNSGKLRPELKPALLMLRTAQQETKTTLIDMPSPIGPLGGTTKVPLTESSFKPFLEDVGRANFQAISIYPSWAHKVQVGSAKVGSATEQALYVVQTDKIQFYRLNDGTKTASEPKITGIGSATNRFRLPWALETDSNAIESGDTGLLFAESSITQDPIRYIEITDQDVARTVRKVLPASTPELSSDGSYATMEIWGMSDLAPGKYYLKAWNSGSYKEISFKVAATNLITAADHADRMNKACGIVPSTLPGKMYPSSLTVTLKTKLGDAKDLQKVRLVERKLGKVIDLTIGAVGSTSEAWVQDDQVFIPLATTLVDGEWEIWLKIEGLWSTATNSIGTLRKVSGSAADACQSQVVIVNDLFPGMCDAKNVYTGSGIMPPSYHEMQRGSKGNFRYVAPFSVKYSPTDPAIVAVQLFGRLFDAPYPVKSLAIVQDGEPVAWSLYNPAPGSLSPRVFDLTRSNGSVAPAAGFSVNFEDSDLSTKLTAGKSLAYYLYPEPKDKVIRDGIPPIGKTPADWRMVKTGVCPDAKPEITALATAIDFSAPITPGVPPSFKTSGKNVLRALASGNFMFTDKSGREYALPLSYSTDEWLTERQTDDKTTLTIYRPTDIEYYRTDRSRSALPTKALEIAPMGENVSSVEPTISLSDNYLKGPIPAPLPVTTPPAIHTVPAALPAGFPAASAGYLASIARFVLGVARVLPVIDVLFLEGDNAAYVNTKAEPTPPKPDDPEDEANKLLYLVRYHVLVDDYILRTRGTDIADFKPESRAIVVRATPKTALIIATKALMARHRFTEPSRVTDRIPVPFTIPLPYIAIQTIEEIREKGTNPKKVPHQIYYGIGAYSCPLSGPPKPYFASGEGNLVYYAKYLIEKLFNWSYLKAIGCTNFPPDTILLESVYTNEDDDYTHIN